VPGDARTNSLGEIQLAAYDRAWPRHYVEERARLTGLAGGVFSNIEHFGSTAVPGLRAKPTIDIMTSTRDLHSLEAITPGLRDEGYVEMSENFAFRRFFRKATSADRPSFHLHVVTDAAWPNKSERIFRDWLIAHPQTAEAYVRLKGALALRFADDREAYTEAKSEFIRAVVNEARRSLGLAPLTDWAE